MSKVLSIRVSDEVLTMLDRLAESRDRSRSWVTGRLIENAAREAVEFADFIQEGVAAAENGDFFTQEQMKDWVNTLRASRKKAA